MEWLLSELRQSGIKAGSLFSRYDTQGHGTLSALDLRRGLLAAGVPVSAGTLNDIMTTADLDGDGRLSWCERERERQGVVCGETPQPKPQSKANLSREGRKGGR